MIKTGRDKKTGQWFVQLSQKISSSEAVAKKKFHPVSFSQQILRSCALHFVYYSYKFIMLDNDKFKEQPTTNNFFCSRCYLFTKKYIIKSTSRPYNSQYVKNNSGSVIRTRIYASRRKMVMASTGGPRLTTLIHS